NEEGYDLNNNNIIFGVIALGPLVVLNMTCVLMDLVLDQSSNNRSSKKSRAYESEEYEIKHDLRSKKTE
ncbi:hypothetical protein ACJX0J_028905, partial [Zea mays]